jgi:hypothetical protein
VKVLISTETAGSGGDLASLRAWLDDAGGSVPWALSPERPATGTLGFGVDEICAVVAAVEGLPRLIQWIKSWSESKQESPAIVVTIAIAGHSLNGKSDGNNHDHPADGPQGIASGADGGAEGNASEPDA